MVRLTSANECARISSVTFFSLQMTRAALCAKVAVKSVSMCNLSSGVAPLSPLVGRCDGLVRVDAIYDAFFGLCLLLRFDNIFVTIFLCRIPSFITAKKSKMTS